MEIVQREVGGVVVLDVKGKMAFAEHGETLKSKIAELVAAGKKKVVLNLAGVPYVDSSGLGELVRAYTTIFRSGGKLKLLNLTKRIEDLMTITKTITIFETFTDEADAVESFGEVPAGDVT